MIIPEKLKKWDEIRVIAPARSLSIVWWKNTELAIKHIKKQWYKVTFWKHVWKIDNFNSSSINSRIEDLHDAFLDSNVKAIFTAIWWYNTNQLLDYIDYDIIKNNPKILIGFSDITAIANAITHVTWMITYSWPHFSTWAMEKWFEYNLTYFKKCLTQDAPFEVIHSDYWSDDPWFIDQNNRNFIPDNEYWIINKWNASWKIIWWHARCLACLQWTKYMPKLENSILFLEEDAETNWPIFDRLIQSLIHQEDFFWVKWIIIGRFQKESNITKDDLIKIIKTKKELDNIPVVANADFWHTNPIITFPIWWEATLFVDENVKLEIIKH